MAQAFKNCKMIDNKSFPYTNVSQPSECSPYKQIRLTLYLCPYRDICIYKQVHKYTYTSYLSFLKQVAEHYSHTYQRLLFLIT